MEHGQVYNDKSETYLKSKSLTFYLIHVPLLNSKESRRREQITSGKSTIAYLSKISNYLEKHRGISQKSLNLKFCKSGKLRALQAFVDFPLSALMSLLFNGFSVCTAHNRSFACLPGLTPFVADVPEIKDMHSVKHGVRTDRRPCMRCLVQKEDHWKFSKSLRQDISKSASVTSGTNMQGNSIRRKEKVDSLSIYYRLPVFCQFPLIGIDKGAELYTLFSFEPMHVQHIDIPKLLKNSQ